ncbi:MAG: hypothetical protein ACREIR_23880 [Geminicoccaceae bacterium]
MARRPRKRVRIGNLDDGGVAIGLRHGVAVVGFEVCEHRPAPLPAWGLRVAGAGWPATDMARVGSGCGVLAA